MLQGVGVVEGLSDEYLVEFVGKKASYYLPKWKDFQRDGNTAKINFAALVFGTTWLAYRRMYRYAFALYGMATLVGIIEVVAKVSSLLSDSIAVAFFLGVGIFGNYLYYCHTKNRVLTLKPKFQTDAALRVKLREAGGTSVVGAIAFTSLTVSIAYVDVLIEVAINYL